MVNENKWLRKQISPASCLCIACKLRMVFTFLEGLKKLRSRIIFCDTRELYEIQISVYKSNVLLKHSYIH